MPFYTSLMLLDLLVDPHIFIWPKYPAGSLLSLTNVWGSHVIFSFNLRFFFFLLPPPAAHLRPPPYPPRRRPAPPPGELLPHLALRGHATTAPFSPQRPPPRRTSRCSSYATTSRSTGTRSRPRTCSAWAPGGSGSGHATDCWCRRRGEKKGRKPRVLVAGGGICGLVLALAARRMGYEVMVIELARRGSKPAAAWGRGR